MDVAPAIWSVTSLTRYIKDLFAIDYRLQDIWVQAEVSNFTRATSGHLYFTLKDDSATIKCIMWRSQAIHLRELPQHGQSVLAHGSVGVYEAGGNYQLYVDEVHPAGLGDLHLAFQILVEQLRQEGLFAEERKRSLPEFPRRIGIVTSPVGAALRDILNILRRRNPLVEVVVAPAAVQGVEAPAQICAALEALNVFGDVDVIILARGGGSLEDLWAFNDEAVARAIAASSIPVVSGVGHETDFTIADFAADLRAPTPSAAAELVAPHQDELRSQATALHEQLAAAMTDMLAERRWQMESQNRSLRHLSPEARLGEARRQLTALLLQRERTITAQLAVRREQVRGTTLALGGLSPLGTLQRGFALVERTADGRLVRSTQHVGPGDSIRVRVADGQFGAKVIPEN